MRHVAVKPIPRPRIVQPPSLRRRLFTAVVVLGVLALTHWQAYSNGRHAKVGVTADSEALVEDLQAQLEEVRNERSELGLQLAGRDQTLEVDKEASREIKEQIKQLQEDRLRLQEELALLRGLAATGTDKDGLNVQRFNLREISERLFGFKFVVSQVLENVAAVDGRIWISVDGEQGGKPTNFPIGKLSDKAGEGDSIEMGFKHFQEVEGRLKLPDGFKPRSFKIEVKPQNKGLKNITRTYPWKMGVDEEQQG